MDYYRTRILMQKMKEHLAAEYAVHTFGHLFPMHHCGQLT